jgi:hypothetical protein
MGERVKGTSEQVGSVKGNQEKGRGTREESGRHSEVMPLCPQK